MGSLEGMMIGLDGIGHALSDNSLRVPHYQRSYAWTERLVEELVRDIATALRQNDKEYFLGSIVVTRQSDDRSLEVVDGQQRLATITILLAAIRDYFYRQGDVKRAEGINNEYLAPTNIRTQDVMPKLHLDSLDDDFFQKRVLSHPDSSDRKLAASRPSHFRIAEAATLAAKHVETLATLTNRPTDYLLDWVEYIDKHVKVVWIVVPDQADAFTIFETLNHRGLALAISDLLKNYLFGIARERINEAQQRWTLMLGSLESVGGEDILVTFIRHFWSSKYGVTREKELFDKLKQRITGKREAIEYSGAFADSAKLYAAILSPDHELWDKYGPAAAEHIRTLNLLGLIQMRPLLLSILDSFSVREVQRTLRLLVSWSVRLLIQGGLGTGPLESFYSQCSVDVREGKITTARDLVTAAHGTIPSDNQFRATFATKSVSQAHLARYYLRVLERQERGDSEPALIPNSDTDAVNLEHILPQHPSGAWGHIDPDVVQDVYNRIGNLTLLERRLNSAIGNQGFTAKSQEYVISQFILTKKLTEYVSWGAGEIEDRQKHLADLAVKAWPITVQ